MWHPRPLTDEESPSDRTDALYREHQALVTAICRLLLRDRGEAEDAAQQVFLSAHRALMNGAVPREPAAWIATITRNECRLRRHRRALVLIGDEIEIEDLVSVDPATQAMQRAELQALWHEIATLPAAQRDALLLREICGLSYDQLATELDVTHASARSLLGRAREHLRTRLRDVSVGIGGGSWVAQLARLIEGGPVLGGPAVGAGRLAVVAVGAATLVSGAGSDAHLRGTTPPAPPPKHAPVTRNPVVRASTPVVRRRTAAPSPPAAMTVVVDRRRDGDGPSGHGDRSRIEAPLSATSRSGPDGGSSSGDSSGGSPLLESSSKGDTGDSGSSGHDGGSSDGSSESGGPD